MLDTNIPRDKLTKILLLCVGAFALMLVTFELTRLTVSPTTLTETVTVKSPEWAPWSLPITVPKETEGVVELGEPYWFAVKSIDKNEMGVCELKDVTFTWLYVIRVYNVRMYFPDGYRETIQIGLDGGTVSNEDHPRELHALLISHGEWKAGAALDLPNDRIVLLLAQPDNEYIHSEINTQGKTKIDDTEFHLAILNQSYYDIWRYPEPSKVTFREVRFVFPPYQLITPAGPQIKVDIGFPDGREESLTGTIIGPSQTSVRLLTESKNPQAGIELNINGEIKLLVSEIE